jgi:hypothetical protein
MRKIFLIAVIGIGFGITSRKKETVKDIKKEEILKERTCRCTDSNSGVSVFYDLNKGYLRDQKEECERKSTNITTCSLDLL